MRQSSAPRLTAAHVAKVHRVVPEREVPTPHRKMDAADQETYARRLLDDLGSAPFWVFAYGSLIWKPAFDHVEARTVHLAGWRRRFCLKLTNWRATPEQPGLMLALDRGGSCVGVAYRMPEDAPLERMIRLLHRETSHHEDMRWQRWVTVRSGAERFRALAFWCAPSEPAPDLLRLPIEEQAAWIARSVGFAGSGPEYLLNTVDHLEQLGLHDSYLWRLQSLVAAEIGALPG
jgi:cation transport protein ChaC